VIKSLLTSLVSLQSRTRQQQQRNLSNLPFMPNLTVTLPGNLAGNLPGSQGKRAKRHSSGGEDSGSSGMCKPGRATLQ